MKSKVFRQGYFRRHFRLELACGGHESPSRAERTLPTGTAQAQAAWTRPGSARLVEGSDPLRMVPLGEASERDETIRGVEANE